MTVRSIKQWCHSVLPANFTRINAETSKIHQFLVDNVPEPSNRQLRVMTVTQDEIVVAVNNPQIANYLRLHALEIEQQIRESLKIDRTLKFRSMPDSIFDIEPYPGTNKTTPVSSATVDAIDHSANWVEDEKVKQALQTLVRTLKQK